MNRPPVFDPKLLHFAQRFPQRAKVLKLPTAKQMMIANAKSQQETRTMAMVDYMRAQEKSQQEVVDAWNRYQETFLEELVQTGCPEAAIEMDCGPVDEATFSGDVTIKVQGAPFAKLFRKATEGTTEEGKPATVWEFTAEFMEPEEVH